MLLFLFRCKDTYYFGYMTICQQFFCDLSATCSGYLFGISLLGIIIHPPAGAGGQGGAALCVASPRPNGEGGQGGRGRGGWVSEDGRTGRSGGCRGHSGGCRGRSEAEAAEAAATAAEAAARTDRPKCVDG